MLAAAAEAAVADDAAAVLAVAAVLDGLVGAGVVVGERLAGNRPREGPKSVVVGVVPARLGAQPRGALGTIRPPCALHAEFKYK